MASHGIPYLWIDQNATMPAWLRCNEANGNRVSGHRASDRAAVLAAWEGQMRDRQLDQGMPVTPCGFVPVSLL